MIKPQVVSPDSQKVLVIMTDYHLGDFIMGLPTIEALADYFEYGIGLVIREAHRPLVEHLPSAKKIAIHSYAAGRKVRNFRQLFVLLGLCLKLLFARYRTVFSVSYRITCSMIALSTLAPHRIGLTSARRNWVFNDQLTPVTTRHKMDFYATVLTRIGLTQRPPVVGPVPDEIDVQRVRKIIKDLDGPGDEFAVIHPFSGKVMRSWPKERFLNVADELIERYCLKVCLIGSPGERHQLEEMRHLAKQSGSIAVVADSMGMTLATLSLMGLFLGNLSGPAHLAGLISDAPIICISGPTDIRYWSPPPRHERMAMLHGQICPGKCMKDACKLEARCIRQVQVEGVLFAIEKLVQ